MARTYSQYCGLARALDLVGERWSLLLVRDLGLGPRRYSDLLQGLPGIGTSLLAARLQRLENAGIVRRRDLPPPAASTVYELTDAGGELLGAVVPLAMWGVRHLFERREPGEAFKAAWPLMAMRETISAPPDIDAVYEFEIEGSTAHLTVRGGRVEVGEGPPPRPPDARITTDVETLRAVGLHGSPLPHAVASGRLQVEGDHSAIGRLAAMLGLAVDGAGAATTPSRSRSPQEPDADGADASRLG